jgi:hypothetical protein
VLLIVLGILVGAACTSTVQPSLSVPPVASPSAADGVGLPPGCEPIELRSPTGERIDLDGTWVEDAEDTPMVWRIRTEGTCIWGSGEVEDIPYEETREPSSLQILRGHFGTDFTIAGEIVLLGPEAVALPPPIWAEVRFDIEVDENGEVRLREDRERGVPGPRCVEPTFACYPPLVLVRER